VFDKMMPEHSHTMFCIINYLHYKKMLTYKNVIISIFQSTVVYITKTIYQASPITFCLGFRVHSICHMATFQLYWWRKTQGALACTILGMNRHLSWPNKVL
jgi:hypothetical protein